MTFVRLFVCLSVCLRKLLIHVSPSPITISWYYTQDVLCGWELREPCSLMPIWPCVTVSDSVLYSPTGSRSCKRVNRDKCSVCASLGVWHLSPLLPATTTDFSSRRKFCASISINYFLIYCTVYFVWCNHGLNVLVQCILYVVCLLF